MRLVMGVFLIDLVFVADVADGDDQISGAG